MTLGNMRYVVTVISVAYDLSAAKKAAGG